MGMSVFNQLFPFFFFSNQIFSLVLRAFFIKNTHLLKNSLL